MSGAQIGQLFNIGPQIVGQVLGLPYQQYRPTTANNPLGVGNLLGTINAWITPDGSGKALKAAAYGKPVWFGLFDPTITMPGDYLVGPLGTFFIASQDVPQPMQVVLCNHTVSITRPAPMSGVGALSGYGGDQRSNETPVSALWPCSMLQGTKGEIGATKLPGDAKMPWSTVLLPPIPGVVLRNNDIMTDENNFRHIMSSTELSALGWRLTSMLATT